MVMVRHKQIVTPALHCNTAQVCSRHNIAGYAAQPEKRIKSTELLAREAPEGEAR